MITHQPVNNHDDLAKVVDGLLEEAGLPVIDISSYTGVSVGCLAG